MFMTRNAILPVPADCDTIEPCRRALLELMEIGMAQARRLEVEPGAVEGDAATFERVSRAIRRTVRMLRWLDEPHTAPGTDRLAARKRILRAVEDRIDQEADPEKAGGLHAELLERMDTAELEHDVAGRPAVEIVGEICRDLGLAPEDVPGLRRSLADVAALHARAAAAVGATCAVPAPELRLAQGPRMIPGGDAQLWACTDATLDRMEGRKPRPQPA